MKQFLFFLFTLIFVAPQAHAGKVAPFKGLYEVLGEQGRADQKFVVCDVDTVGNIWAKYGDGELPPGMVPIKDEPSVLVGFTFRAGTFFVLESNAMVTGDLLALPGPDNNLLNLKRKPDGTYELGVRIDNVVTFYNLGPQQALPWATQARNKLLQPLQID
jgi:hypothetical protein